MTGPTMDPAAEDAAKEAQLAGDIGQLCNRMTWYLSTVQYPGGIRSVVGNWKRCGTERLYGSDVCAGHDTDALLQEVKDLRYRVKELELKGDGS